MGCAFYSDCKKCLDVRNGEYCDIKAKLDKAMEILDNVSYWETCPEEYKKAIVELKDIQEK